MDKILSTDVPLLMNQSPPERQHERAWGLQFWRHWGSHHPGGSLFLGAAAAGGAAAVKGNPFDAFGGMTAAPPPQPWAIQPPELVRRGVEGVASGRRRVH